jgi:hypothetical protein
MEKTDCFIKDEGDFITIGFVSERAKEIIKHNAPNDVLYGDDVLKMDIELKSKQGIVTWLVSHNLTFTSDI